MRKIKLSDGLTYLEKEFGGNSLGNFIRFSILDIDYQLSNIQLNSKSKIDEDF